MTTHEMFAQRYYYRNSYGNAVNQMFSRLITTNFGLAVV